MVKRNAIDEPIDFEGWRAVSSQLIERHVAFNNHHEVIWLLWMMLSCEIELSERLIETLVRVDNSHVSALISQSFLDGRVSRKPRIRFSKKLSSTDSNWLLNMVARVGGFTKASFGGSMAEEFEHLAVRRIKLVDVDGYVKFLANSQSNAISRSRYGYDDEDDNDLDDVAL